MAILGFEFEEIERIIALMETSGLDEIFWEEGDRSIKVSAPRFANSLPAPVKQVPGMQAAPNRARLDPRPSQKAIAATKTPQVQESGVALVSQVRSCRQQFGL